MNITRQSARATEGINSLNRIVEAINEISTSVIDAKQSIILFDHDGDGVKTASGWVAAGEGILVRDLNGNGSIDSGRELFGDNTRLSNGQIAADGFAALADLDSNSDAQFDASDAEFNNVQLWKDLNQDGISQTEELFALHALGVQSIQLGGTASVLGNKAAHAPHCNFTRFKPRRATPGKCSRADFFQMAFNALNS